MESRVPAGLTPGEGRRFAFPVGGVFLAIAGISWWRGHLTVSTILALLGGALLLLGLLMPARLGPVYRAWMGLAVAISKVTTPIFMGLVYYLLLTPAGILRRRLGRNPLVHSAGGDSFWQDREEGRRKGDLRRQF